MWASKVVNVLSLLSLLSSSVYLALGDENIHPVQLNDEDFEHLTQASTGQTTGKWLVNFMSPGCGFCKQLAPIWEDLAHELGTEHKDLGIINANVNLMDNIELRERFDINSFPTIIYFADRKMYRYDGSRNVDDFVKFAIDGYINKTSEKVPPPMAGWKKAIQEIRKKAADHKVLQDLLKDFEHILDMRKNAAVLLFLFGCVFGFFITVLLGVFSGKKSTKVKMS